MSEERTEQPTGKKLREAREKGQIARSKEVHDAFQLAAALIALTWFGRVMVEGLSRQDVVTFPRVDQTQVRRAEIVSGILPQTKFNLIACTDETMSL